MGDEELKEAFELATNAGRIAELEKVVEERGREIERLEGLLNRARSALAVEQGRRQGEQQQALATIHRLVSLQDGASE